MRIFPSKSIVSFIIVYRSLNKSALYTPSANIFLKLSFTAATSLDFDENVKLYVGLGGYKAGNGEYDEETWLLSDSILTDEYDILRNNKSVRGFMLYSYNSLEDDTAKKEINNLINALN